MNGTPTLDGLTGEQLHNQFAELEARLLDTYGSERRATVHRTVIEERGRFADARIRAFVPILVERSARVRLDAPERR